jgi:ribonuclease HI/exonuclease III
MTKSLAHQQERSNSRPGRSLVAIFVVLFMVRSVIYIGKYTLHPLLSLSNCSCWCTYSVASDWILLILIIIYVRGYWMSVTTRVCLMTRSPTRVCLMTRRPTRVCPTYPNTITQALQYLRPTANYTQLFNHVFLLQDHLRNDPHITSPNTSSMSRMNLSDVYSASDMDANMLPPTEPTSTTGFRTSTIIPPPSYTPKYIAINIQKLLSLFPRNATHELPAKLEEELQQTLHILTFDFYLLIRSDSQSCTDSVLEKYDTEHPIVLDSFTPHDPERILHLYVRDTRIRNPIDPIVDMDAFRHTYLQQFSADPILPCVLSASRISSQESVIYEFLTPSIATRAANCPWLSVSTASVRFARKPPQNQLSTPRLQDVYLQFPRQTSLEQIAISLTELKIHQAHEIRHILHVSSPTFPHLYHFHTSQPSLLRRATVLVSTSGDTASWQTSFPCRHCRGTHPVPSCLGTVPPLHPRYNYAYPTDRYPGPQTSPQNVKKCNCYIATSQFSHSLPLNTLASILHPTTERNYRHLYNMLLNHHFEEYKHKPPVKQPPPQSKLEVFSLNIKGLSDQQSKLTELGIQMGYRDRASVIFLQETNLKQSQTDNTHHSLNRLFPNHINFIHSHSTTPRGKGVITLLPKEWETYNSATHQHGGRLLAVDTIFPFDKRLPDTKSTAIRWINIYAPSSPTDRQQNESALCNTLSKLINSALTQDMEIVLAGDFNGTLMPSRDRYPESANTSEEPETELLRLITDYDFCECHLNLGMNAPTYFRLQVPTSRIDYIFCTPGLASELVDANTHHPHSLNLTTLDHAMIHCTFNNTASEGIRSRNHQTPPRQVFVTEKLSSDTITQFQKVSAVHFKQILDIMEFNTLNHVITDKKSLSDHYWLKWKTALLTSAEATIPTKTISPHSHIHHITRKTRMLAFWNRILRHWSKHTRKKQTIDIPAVIHTTLTHKLTQHSKYISTLTEYPQIPAYAAPFHAWLRSLRAWYNKFKKHMLTVQHRETLTDIHEAVDKRQQHWQTKTSRVIARLLNRNSGRVTKDKVVTKDSEGRILSVINDPETVKTDTKNYMAKWQGQRPVNLEGLCNDPFWNNIYAPRTEIPDDLFANILDEPTEEELMTAINETPNKAPGLSRIPAALLKILDPHGIESLRRIIALTFKSGFAPDDWVKGMIYPTPKGATSWEADLANTRPITLLEIPRKIMFKIITNRMVPLLAKHNVLPGFNPSVLPGTSTNHVLHLLNAIMEDARASHKELWIVFQDMKRAYDSVDKTAMIAAMKRIKLPKSLIYLYSNITDMRQNCVHTAYGLTDFYHPLSGLDQGGVECPLFWRIFYDPLLTAVQQLCPGYVLSASRPTNLPLKQSTTTTVQISAAAYVDDTTWIARSKDEMDRITAISRQFYDLMGIEINTKKTKLLVFNERNATQHIPFLFGTPPCEVPRAEKNTGIRLLGNLFSVSGSNTDQRKQIREIVQAAITSLKYRMVTDQQVAYIIRSVLWPQIEYKTKTRMLSQSDCKTIQTQLFQLLKMKAGLPKSFPTSLLINQNTYCIPPLYEHLVSAHVADLLKSLRQDSPSSTAIRIRLQQLSNQHCLTKSPLDTPLPFPANPRSSPTTSVFWTTMLWNTHHTIATNPIDFPRVSGGQLPLDQYLPPDELVSYSKHLAPLQIYFADQLMNNRKEFLNYREFCLIYRTQTPIHKQQMPSWYSSLLNSLQQSSLPTPTWIANPFLSNTLTHYHFKYGENDLTYFQHPSLLTTELLRIVQPGFLQNQRCYLVEHQCLCNSLPVPCSGCSLTDQTHITSPPSCRFYLPEPSISPTPHNLPTSTIFSSSDSAIVCRAHFAHQSPNPKRQTTPKSPLIALSTLKPSNPQLFKPKTSLVVKLRNPSFRQRATHLTPQQRIIITLRQPRLSRTLTIPRSPAKHTTLPAPLSGHHHSIPWTDDHILITTHSHPMPPSFTPIVGDGNCLYRSIAVGMGLTQNHHPAMRNTSNDILSSCEQSQLTKEYIDEYRQAQQQLGTYGEIPTLVAFAQHYYVHFLIYSKHPSECLSIRHSDTPATDPAYQIHLQRTGKNNSSHFQLRTFHKTPTPHSTQPTVAKSTQKLTPPHNTRYPPAPPPQKRPQLKGFPPIQPIQDCTHTPPLVAYTDGSLCHDASPSVSAGYSCLIIPTATNNTIHSQSTTDLLSHPHCYGDVPAGFLSSTKAELIAIIAALRLAPPSSPLTIYTDSQNCVTQFPELTSTEIQHSNQQHRSSYHATWSEIRYLVQHYRANAPTKVDWVKAHNGHPGNETADLLAARHGSSRDEHSLTFQPSHPTSLPLTAELYAHDTLVETDPRKWFKYSYRLRHALAIPALRHYQQNCSATNLLYHIDTNLMFKYINSSIKPTSLFTRTSISTQRTYRMKAIFGYLPTLDFLHQRKPHLYPTATCPHCSSNVIETQVHIWSCPSRKHLLETTLNELLRKLQSLYPLTYTPVTNALRSWLFCQPAPVLPANTPTQIASLIAQITNFPPHILLLGLIPAPLISLIQTISLTSRPRCQSNLYKIITETAIHAHNTIWNFRCKQTITWERTLRITPKQKRQFTPTTSPTRRQIPDAQSPLRAQYQHLTPFLLQHYGRSNTLPTLIHPSSTLHSHGHDPP